MKTNKFLLVALFFVTVLNACKKDKDEPIKEGIANAELTFTEVSGNAVEAHGDHFHGLADAIEGKKTVVKFNDKGAAITNGHLHLHAEGVYKVELKAWNYDGKEMQNQYIVNKAAADQYKAFLVGGNFILNANSTHESGAIFQPRETKHGDGTEVTGAGGIGTVGIVSYFTMGHDNEAGTKSVSYVLRKLDNGVKATVTRNDWNRNDYASKFSGQNVLTLNFEIHAESH